MRKDAVIRVAVSVLIVSAAAGCQTTPTQRGALAGAAAGGATGAVIGHQQGRQGEGALIGAGVGALAGALIGDQVDERRERTAAAIETEPRGHCEMRVVTGRSGERYEERVWVPGP
ncbi:MAG: glycine zipper 2TM domain-containing protein [Candidatus Hydrogenedentes bacterium]|nr:glycine zipper 2TM domain-containing protein [Candidatus Hydrogenedentota bacterium]